MLLIAVIYGNPYVQATAGSMPEFVDAVFCPERRAALKEPLARASYTNFCLCYDEKAPLKLSHDIVAYAEKDYADYTHWLLNARTRMPYCRDGSVNKPRLKELVKKEARIGQRLGFLVWSGLHGYASDLCGGGKHSGAHIQFEEIFAAGDFGVGGAPLKIITVNLEPLYRVSEEVVARRLGLVRVEAAQELFKFVVAYAQCYCAHDVQIDITWLPNEAITIPVFCTKLVGLNILMPDYEAPDRALTISPFIAPALKKLTILNAGLKSCPWQLPSLVELDVRFNEGLVREEAFAELYAPGLCPCHTYAD